MSKNDLLLSLKIPENIQSKWQNIVDIMAKITNVPAGLIMRLVNKDITVFISSKNDKNPYMVGAKEHFEDSGLYCETAIKTKNMLLVPNALTDEDWKTNPDIELNMISYLGFPITLPDKTPFGTICILDNKENQYSELYIDLMKNFQIIIETDLELIYANYLLGEENKQLSDYITEIQTLRKILPTCAKCKKVRDSKGYWSKLEEYFSTHSEIQFSHGLCENCEEELYGNEEWYIEKKRKAAN